MGSFNKEGEEEMKVIYKSMYQQILDAKRRADRIDRPIEEIILTKEEWDDLDEEMCEMFSRPPVLNQTEKYYLLGVTIRKESCASC